ncbi:uncharacterized protein LOC125009534 isoform X1 [Mugil cephalus]|uniref:uncharacterized protein LOC125009534 isoform X1 n=1 Tax=Mugil cephalus TaxID=48193 RepID=UPI001FB74032|nr:uncharacterized protein LOC125009534 isoform X1 [Mugil cephalus]
MEMCLKQSILVFLAVGVAGMVASMETSVYVDDKEKTVEVAAGSNLILHCNVTSATSVRSRVVWNFSPSGSSGNDSRVRSLVVINGPTNNSGDPQKHDSKMKCQDKMCTISEVDETDSGWYFCHDTTEIPFLDHKGSNGTKVVVWENLVESTAYPSLVANTSDGTKGSNGGNDLWLWILLAVFSVILIVLLVIFILHRRQRRRSREEDPIYANTRPVALGQPSPQPGEPAKSLKTAHSSQNLRSHSPAGRYEEGRRRYER